MPLFDQDAFGNSRYDAKDDIKDKELAVDMASDSAPHLLPPRTRLLQRESPKSKVFRKFGPKVNPPTSLGNQAWTPTWKFGHASEVDKSILSWRFRLLIYREQMGAVHRPRYCLLGSFS